tara:strand:- start:1488 stop:1613 length:126 start_codon:yes stop_codon:yes gene_type:complete
MALVQAEFLLSGGKWGNLSLISSLVAGIQGKVSFRISWAVF